MRAGEGNYANWNFLTADQARGNQAQVFAAGSWGGDYAHAIVTADEIVTAFKGAQV